MYDQPVWQRCRLERATTGRRVDAIQGNLAKAREPNDSRRALAAAAYAVSVPLFLWMSPVIVGLLLASPMAALTASAALGHATRRLGLLLTPEERVPPDVVRRANELASTLRSSEPASRLWKELLIDSTFSMQHREMLPEAAPRPFGQVNIDLVIALAKLDHCVNAGDAGIRWSVSSPRLCSAH
jgi:membrane glycosyltransferase